MSYVYLPWRWITYALVGATWSGVYGQSSLKMGQGFYTDGPHSFERAVIMSDVVGGGSPTYVPGSIFWSGDIFASQHFDGRNLGGNVLHGDGSVEWVAFESGRWVDYNGNGYYNVPE
jgi:hypothetical protein